FAGYDEVPEHIPQTVECDFIVFTDGKSKVPATHRVFIREQPGDQTSPALQNGWLRIFPFNIAELDQYDIVIYIDANVRICDPCFVEHILTHFDKVDDIDVILSAHPWNACAYKEASDSQTIAKYRNTDLEGQMEFYRRAGFPADAGLYWN